MLKRISLTKRQQILSKIIIAISCFFLTTLLSNRFNSTWILIGSSLSLVISIIILIKHIDIKEINKKSIIVAILISIYTIKLLLGFCNTNLLMIQQLTHINNKDIIKIVLGILSIPALTTIIYIFINRYYSKIKIFFKELTKTERLYLKIVMLIGILLTVTLTYFTTAFTKPVYKNKIIDYDVIYTSDTGTLTKNNAYINVSHSENDIRQPLFGVFSLPFSIPAKMISEFLFFIPNSYEVCLTLIQFLLTTITTILISRMLSIEEKNKKYFYILFSCSYSYILFNIVLEQYTIGLFYLILALYIYFKEKQKSINYYYIPATGTLLTTGIIFPIITKFKNIKQWLLDIMKCLFTFISVLIISGQFPQILGLMERYLFFSTTFVGKISFTKKIYQFTNFIKGLFIAVPGRILKIMNHPSYQLINLKSVSIIGIVILLICLISYIINRKNKFCLISLLWVFFSIIILLIIGWGTVENGLILYSLYFAWAYLSLYFMFIKKLFKNRTVFISIVLISCILMFIININEFINIIKFAVKYY